MYSKWQNINLSLKNQTYWSNGMDSFTMKKFIKLISRLMTMIAENHHGTQNNNHWLYMTKKLVGQTTKSFLP